MNEIKNTEYRPLVSIIIAVLNGAKTLQSCLNSIEVQDYTDWELIILDGGSTDGTEEIINASKCVTYSVSEPDGGIYSAWNKGLGVAKGKWVCFLGADDQWANETSLSMLVNAAYSKEVDLVSGKMVTVNENGRIKRTFGKPWNWVDMKKYCCITHCGTLHRADLFQKFGRFSENYSIASDYEFLLRIGKNTRAAFVDEVVVKMGDCGVSRTSIRKIFTEVKQMQSVHPEIGPLSALNNYYLAFAKYFVRKTFNSF